MELPVFIACLRGANSLEDVASVLLRALLERGAMELDAAGVNGQMTQALIHLRPQGSYRSLMLLRPGQVRVEQPREGAAFLPSATAWHHVLEHRCPVAIDARIGSVTVLGKPTAQLGVDEGRTLRTMRRRKATHLLVSPLIDVRGELIGQLSLEASAPRHFSDSFVWESCLEWMTALVDVATPYLALLPCESPESTADERTLPVVGPSMKPLIHSLRVFARHGETLLLLGETGTGKSRLARWCHEVSPRAEAVFEVVDLSAIPRELQQAELFGWRRGAFTGAAADHPGALGRAQGGTLFLDEIDKLSLETQASLLRLLEDGEYRALGDKRHRSANVRFIIGTNAQLEREIGEGRFLRDLYYRINVLPVRLPALRERPDELAEWAEFMVLRRARETGIEVEIEPEVHSRLLGYSWPGNLRQLDNVMRRSFALAQVDSVGHEGAGSIAVTGDHVRQALAMESGSSPAPSDAGVMPVLARASARLIEAAQRAGGLNLDEVVAGIRGLLILTAVERASTIEEALELIGRERLLKSRNHQRALRIAREQVEALRALVDEGL